MTAKLSAEELADILSNEAAPAMVERESLNDATRECLQLAILDAAAELSRLSAQVREAEALIADLQAHAKEEGWQDVDEPIAALLAYPLPPPPGRLEKERTA